MIKVAGLMLGLIIFSSGAMATVAESTNQQLLDLIAAKQHKLGEEGRGLSTTLSRHANESGQSNFYTTHEVLFLFSSSCPHCHNQAPVLKQWAVDVGAAVVAYSFDGIALPEFKEALPVPSSLVVAAFEGQPIRYPALFVMNKKTRALYPVAIGELNLNQLENRMSVLVPKIIAFEGVGR